MNEGARIFVGYAFESSRRYPKDPVTVIAGQVECSLGRFVGTARIDGQEMNAFRVARPGRPVRYFFQVQQGC